MAHDAEDEKAAIDLAMKPFSQLNKIENDHPLPLIYYYRSYAQRGVEPPENAKHALERAAELAPFDKGLWMQAAMMQMQEGKIAIAKSSLQPLANDPHGGNQADRVKNIIALLDKTEEGSVITSRDLAVTAPVAQVSVPAVPGDDDSDGGADE